MSDTSNLACLQLIDSETSAEMKSINRLRFQHAELYREYLTRIEGNLSDPVEKKLHAELSDRLDTILEKKPQHRSLDNQDGVYFAPMTMPLERRLQTLAALSFNFFTGMWIFFAVLALVLYLVPHSQYFFLIYIGFIVYDNQRPVHPSFRRSSEWYRSSRLFKLLAAYYPVRVVRRPGATLDPTKNYLFGYHPHGVQAQGAMLSFGTNAGNLGKLFPGLWSSVQTLPLQFKVPLWRELCIAGGAGDASKANILKSLRGGPGKSTCLVVGGAAESLDAAPHTARLTLKNRKGFVKLALVAGASLVPVYAFGENDVYHNLAAEKPELRKMQRRIQKVVSFAPLLVQGRGVFTYSGGLIPHRRPISVVVGDAIDLPRTPEPTQQQIDEAHAKYCAALTKLYNTYRNLYDPETELVIA
eukprot:PhM_4_TR4298/c0_g1_i1/m.45099/K14457/MOGAT2, MGAT2; 2-acylglycerol O-acyltransferase 2